MEEDLTSTVTEVGQDGPALPVTFMELTSEIRGEIMELTSEIRGLVCKMRQLIQPTPGSSLRRSRTVSRAWTHNTLSSTSAVYGVRGPSANATRQVGCYQCRRALGVCFRCASLGSRVSVGSTRTNRRQRIAAHRLDYPYPPVRRNTGAPDQGQYATPEDWEGNAAVAEQSSPFHELGF
ncbi:hypothetical protein J5N97_001238 [Dioscorea zingiberensis]|uniref:Uncharacterized protein n=1 Tax=Dioscorea zingiberensis TaxID=325984 RepID=A0A9D5H2G4_9LILI|nr:hypothetical protein J5N97_001238 [Dioscorea zingiberensis]